MMKNKLADLNDHLFAQLERLSDEGLDKEAIETEVRRGEAIVGIADKIIQNAALQLKGAALIAEHGERAGRFLPMLEGKK